jgi:DNA-binding NarL/FixJ family response regulator
MPPIDPTFRILIFDHDDVLREALRNFLLAAGYVDVEVAATTEETFGKLKAASFHLVFFAITPFLSGRELLREAQRLAPDAKIFPLIDADDQQLIDNDDFDYVIKESVLSNVLGLVSEAGGKP